MRSCGDGFEDIMNYMGEPVTWWRRLVRRLQGKRLR